MNIISTSTRLLLLSPTHCVVGLSLFVWLGFLSSVPSVSSYRFALVPKTTENPFFLSSHEGCLDFCREISEQEEQTENCTCLYGGVPATPDNQNPDPDGSQQVQYVYELVFFHRIQGLAISVKNATAMKPFIDEASKLIPILTFDSDAPLSARLAYVGTDNYFMGQTLAKVAKQLRPTGGTFVVLSPDDSPNIASRIVGFRQEMFRRSNNRNSHGNNDDDDNDDVLWTELYGSPVFYQRNLDMAMQFAQQYAALNPTIMVLTVGGFFFNDGYVDFYRQHAHRNITIISADDFDVQLSYLSRKYVHGLVGQIPFEMGYLAAKLLYQAKQGQVIPNQVGTSLVTHIHVPVVLPELVVDHNLIGNLRVAGYTLLGIIGITALTCASFTWRNREQAVVQAAQPTFLLMIILGVLILASTIVPLSLDDGGTDISHARATWICMSAPWLCCCGLTITFSALFSKTIRINRIVEETRQCHRVTVTVVDVLKPFLILIFLNVLVLTLWSILDPLSYVRSDKTGLDGWNRVISTYGSCQCDDARPYVIPLGAINLGVLLLANWQAYASRKIQSEFAESKFIAICMILLLEAVLIGVPILLVVKDAPQAFYLTISFMIFAICMGVLLLIFIPKISIAADYSHRPELEQRRMLLRQIQRSIPKPAIPAPSSRQFEHDVNLVPAAIRTSKEYGMEPRN